MRRFTTSAALAACALAAVATAGATAPTTTHVTLHRSIPSYLPCPGFVIRAEFDIDRTTQTFSDRSGATIRTVQHVKSDGVLSNPLTGRSIPDTGDFRITVDTDGTRTIEGKFNVATAPGAGIVYQVVGRVVFNPDGTIFEAGPHDDLDGDYGALCDYLAGA